MGVNINTFAQQNAIIHNDFADLKDDVLDQDDPERTFLLWNMDNITTYVRGKTRRVKRGSQQYNDLVFAGFVECG